MCRCFTPCAVRGTCSVNQINPFKSSLVRITLAYVLLFGVSVSLILGVVYWSTIVYTTNQTDEGIEAEIRTLYSVYNRSGYSGLASALSERVRQQRPGDSTLYLLTDSNFQPLVGNISGWPKVAYDQGGWLDFRLDDLLDERGGEFSARAKTFEVDNRFNVLVGQGMKDLRNLKALMSQALLWSLVMTIGLGVIMGYMMRRTLRVRLNAINSISRQIMQGDFHKRIGNGQCVDFVRTCSGAPHTRHWKPGAALYQTQGGKARALHQNRIDAGTLIATFEHGKYPNRRGHHAAVYISHDDRGIWVYDQFLGKATSKRFIRVRYDEAYPSNTAQRYHIIKTHH